MGLGLYILEGKTPVPCPDLVTWGNWYEKHSKDRVVGETKIKGYWVSTIFLGITSQFGEVGLPLLYETMVFGGGKPHDIQRRCCTLHQAVIQHVQVCAIVRKWKKLKG